MAELYVVTTPDLYLDCGRSRTRFECLRALRTVTTAKLEILTRRQPDVTRTGWASGFHPLKL